jgi:hypothetical protein
MASYVDVTFSGNSTSARVTPQVQHAMDDADDSDELIIEEPFNGTLSDVSDGTVESTIPRSPRDIPADELVL